MKKMRAIRTYLTTALRDAGVIELRALGRGTGASGVRSGLFDDVDMLMAAADAVEQSDCYITLNRPKARSVANKLEVDGRGALKDADIERIVRIPFDFDPVRPNGTNSTDAELAAAEQLSQHVANALRSCSWPEPARGMSGNGHHLIYRVSVAANDDTRSTLRRLYRGLAVKYLNEAARFDTTVSNPARIFRLYGTVNRKADPVAGRGQRLSTIWVPDQWDAVQWSAVMRATDVIAPERPALRLVPPVRSVGGGDYRTLDVVGYFQSRGLYRHQIGDGKHAVKCPWVGEHTTESLSGTDSVIWEAGHPDFPTFHCSHDHCAGRGLFAVIEYLGGADQFCAAQWSQSHV